MNTPEQRVSSAGAIPTDDDEVALLWDFRIASDGSLNGKAHDLRWVHLRCDLPEAETHLEKIGCSASLTEVLMTIETRPRCVPMDNGIVLVLRGLNLNPGADPEDMVALRMWFSDKLVITARRRSRLLLSVRDVREALERGAGPATADRLVAEIIERLADRVGDFVDQIEATLEEIETGGHRHRSGTERHRILAELRRDTAQIRRYLAPQREALETLLRIHTTLGADERNAIREQTDRTIRYLEDLDLARERTVLAQEEVRSETAEQQNARMYVLSLITAVFLPLSFLTGVFGMNVAGLPGTEDPSSFLLLALGMAGIAGIVLVLLKSGRWF